jgi:hypothetical protein
VLIGGANRDDTIDVDVDMDNDDDDDEPSGKGQRRAHLKSGNISPSIGWQWRWMASKRYRGGQSAISKGVRPTLAIIELRENLEQLVFGHIWIITTV